MNDAPAPTLANETPPHGLINLLALLAALTAANLLISIALHPLFSPDEGRYARASQLMLETGDWIVPQTDDGPRLQKPPLIYWLQAAALDAFGNNEFAVRLPGALATVGVMLLTFFFARRQRDTLTGLIAAIFLGAMPIVMQVGRLANIDPVLNFFWVAATFAGYLMLHEAHDGALVNKKWRWIFWLALALGVFAKGPIALLPLAATFAWVMLTDRARWRDLMLLRGLILTATPILAWAVIVALKHPQALQVWQHQTVDRITSGSDHDPEPFYFYLPAILIGMFPATAMLSVPGVHFKLAHVKAELAKRDVRAYLAVAALVPLIILSVMAGKMLTYVLPLAAPLAVLAACNLRNLLPPLPPGEGRGEGGSEFERAANRDANPLTPDGMNTLAVVLILAWIGVMIFVRVPGLMQRVKLTPDVQAALHGAIWPLGLVAVLGIATIVFWRRAGGKFIAVGLIAISLNHIWLRTNLYIEPMIAASTSYRPLLDSIAAACKPEDPRIALMGIVDTTVCFYVDAPVPTYSMMNEDELAREPGKRLVFITDAPSWAHYAAADPTLNARFEKVMDWNAPRRALVVYIEKPDTAKVRLTHSLSGKESGSARLTSRR
ncbi:MAG: phospholipid carrier-dependent glycosyltransferase [Planctomycetes bacterium]|nr:phospholipid carrier-dependent glycosyltransferase [Planctomycetota bacterium]